MIIYKYPINCLEVWMGGGVVTIDLPSGAKVLTVQTQEVGGKEEPMIWVQIPKVDCAPVSRKFMVCPTGGEVKYPEHELSYVGTFQLKTERLVFHLFEIV